MTPTTESAPPRPALLTAEEFARRHAGDYAELIDGIVEPIPMPQPLHGHVCTKATLRIGGFVEDHGLGVVCANDTFVLVQRNPDRVRGADLVYWSTAKAPGGVPAAGMITAPPDLCVEVVSPTNTWTEIFTKVGEYLAAGVSVVLVLDPDTATASVYRTPNGHGQETFGRDTTLSLPDVLPGFAVPVRRFFE